MKAFKILFILCLSLKTFSQDSLTTLDDIIFSGPHISFSVIPLVTEKAKITYLEGPYALGSRPMRGIQAGFNYHSNLDRHYSLILGLHGGASVRNYSLFIPKEHFTPVESEDFIIVPRSAQTVDFYISAPLWLEKRWFTGSKGYWNAVGGINIRFYPSQFGETTTYLMNDHSGGYYNIVHLDLEVGTNWKPWIDYNIGGGYTWALGNRNHVRSNLVFNYSGKNITSGSYSIAVPGQQAAIGNYASRHCFLGISIQYILTHWNKRHKKVLDDLAVQ